MNITIERIDDSIIQFHGDEDNLRACYENDKTGRQWVLDFLDKYECTNLWEDEILPVWGEEPTVIYPEPTIDFNSVVLSKQQSIKSNCHDAIVAGFSIDLGLEDESGKPLGELHYSLSESTQSTMRDTYELVLRGATKVTWRDDSRVSHMVYTAEQFTALYEAAQNHILQCRFKSDGLEELLFSYSEEELELVQAITWDTELPEPIQDEISNLLSVYKN